MNDKIVTCADLEHLRGIRMAATDHGSFYRDDQPEKPGALVLLDRLIAAAEADAPPLPEGDYIYQRRGDVKRMVVTYADGQFWLDSECTIPSLVNEHMDRDLLTPLRPTITEADVSESVEAHWSSADHNAWRQLPEWRRDRLIKQAHEFLDQLGIEVTS